jgi:hypothetical protein
MIKIKLRWPTFPASKLYPKNELGNISSLAYQLKNEHGILLYFSIVLIIESWILW